MLRRDRPTYAEAGQRAGIGHAAAAAIIHTYIRNGHRLRHPDEVPLVRRGRPECPLDEHREWLLDQVYDWRFWSLEKRVRALQYEPVGLNINRTTLAHWYKRNGVKWAKPVYHISNRYTYNQLLNLQ